MRRRRQQVANEVRGDEPRAAGHEDALAHGRRLYRRAAQAGSVAELAVDRVEGPSLDVALDAAEVLAHEREDEPCTASTPSTRPPRKRRPGSRGPPSDDPPDADRRGEEAADDADGHAGPLDRLRPEAREHVEGEPDEAKRRVARAVGARLVGEVDLDDAGAGGGTSAFVNFCLPMTPSTGSSAERE